MHEDGKKLLRLMFDPEDTVCLSDSKFGHHSVPLSSALSGEVTLVSPNESVPIKKVSSDKLIFVAINPIKGFRNDSSVYKFQNFMLECDTGSIQAQVAYLHQLKMPYSAIVFSGSKSAHILISLTKPIEDEKQYRTIYEWILNIGTLFDQACKNPSRSIRVAGAIRPETGEEQHLIDIKDRVVLKDLAFWLMQHPEAKPRKKERPPMSETPDLNKVKPWVMDRLTNGLDPTKGRNQQWFAIAVEFYTSGFSLDNATEIMRHFFVEERDFKEKEWITTLESAYKYAYERK